MAENGEKRSQKILEGIQYLAGDNNHLREEILEFARRADEDRRKADADRRKADADRRKADERFDRMIERMDGREARSDERFAAVLDQVKRTNRVAVDIARDIRNQQRLIREDFGQTHRLLHAILKRLPPSNGR